MDTTRNDRLSHRLEALLEEAGLCKLLIDVAADHARLALAAVQRGQAKCAVAIDLKQAPLVSAQKRARGESGIHLVRGDGLSCVRPSRAKGTVLMLAGIGGDLAAQILERSPEAAGAGRVIAQPERHARELRIWMREHGFHLASERAIAESRRLHLILRFERKHGRDPAYGKFALEAELQLGPRLLASTGATATAYLRREHLRLKKLAGRRPDLQPARQLLEARFARQQQGQ